MTEHATEFATLLKQVQAGNKEAAQEFHAVYGPHILRAVRRRLHQKLRSKFDSIDFVQDVWASFFTDMMEQHTFETPEDLVAFLTVIARNKVADAARARLQRQKYNLNREQSIEKDPLGADRFPASQQTPSEIVMDREEWDQFLERQPLVHRRILILLREGKPSINIAEELGVSQRTVNRVLRKVVPGTTS